ncbi:unnamed protein product [Rhizophagus irregularis]|nr:unnamed protein product [Rhizophagus irregularis]
MSFNVASSRGATSNLSAPEQVKEWSRDDVKTFLQRNRTRLDLEGEDIDKNGVPGSPAKEIEKLINEIKGVNMGPPGRIHIFVDNSNLYIQGMANVGNMPYLVGFRPPSYDSLWKYVEKEGFEVETFDRNRQNHEKEVDSEIACAITQTSLLNEPGTIVLISGDKNICPG